MQASGQRPNLDQVRAIQNSLPPDLLRKMRAAGPAGAQKIMQDHMASGGEGLDMGKMMEMMGGMGGMGGLGNMMSGLGGGMPGMGGGGMPGESSRRVLED
jgi:signal recognition particle subunit SRP54